MRTRDLLAAALLAMVLPGCLPPARLQRMQVELETAMRRGDLERAADAEARIGALADEAYGRLSREALAEQSDALRTEACWGGGDSAARKAAEWRAEVEAVLGQDDERILIPAMSEAFALATTKRWDDAERLLDRVAAMCRPSYGRLSETGVCRWWAGNELAFRYEEVGAFEKAAEELIEGRKNHLPMFRDDGRFESSIASSVGRLYADAGRYEEALPYLRRCLELSRPFYERTRPEYTTLVETGDVTVSAGNAAHSFLSQEPRCVEVLLRVLPRVGENDEAARLAAWRRELWQRGPDLEASLREKRRFAEKTWNVDRLTSDHAHDLGFYLAGKERASDAVAAYRDAIVYLERNAAGGRKSAYCAGSISYVDLLLDLASALESAGRGDEAEAAWIRAAQYASAELPPRHPWRWEPYAALADLQARRGNFDGSEKSWRRYLDIVGEHRSRDHADYAFGVRGLAEAASAKRSASGVSEGSARPERMLSAAGRSDRRSVP